MKNKILLPFAAIAFMLCAGIISVKAQTAPPFKVSAIKVVPFDELTGEFQDEIAMKDPRSFFNEVSVGLLITVIVSGKTDTSFNGRKVEITVLEGSKIRAKKLKDASSVGAGGKLFLPVYIDAALCSQVTITAKIIGQKTPSAITRKLDFACGE